MTHLVLVLSWLLSLEEFLINCIVLWWIYINNLLLLLTNPRFKYHIVAINFLTDLLVSAKYIRDLSQSLNYLVHLYLL